MPSHFRPEGNRRCSSHEIAGLARDRLHANPHTMGVAVSCDCDHGVLHLRGWVATYYQKQLAQEAVKGLDGVVKVVNDIEVTG